MNFSISWMVKECENNASSIEIPKIVQNLLKTLIKVRQKYQFIDNLIVIKMLLIQEMYFDTFLKRF